VDAGLEETGPCEKRLRLLPSRVVVYYVLALGQFERLPARTGICGSSPLALPASRTDSTSWWGGDLELRAGLALSYGTLSQEARAACPMLARLAVRPLRGTGRRKCQGTVPQGAGTGGNPSAIRDG